MLHAKTGPNVLLFEEKSLFLFFILWYMEVFNKNKPLQHNCTLQSVIPIAATYVEA